MNCAVRMSSLALAFAILFVLPGLCSESLAISGLGLADKIRGSFRLEWNTYCVGEPILMEFMVANDRDKAFHFNLGAEPAGTLRRNFSFSVKTQAGNDYPKELIGDMGGITMPITIGPGEKHKCWQVLNMWTHLMPPGRYRVRCRAMVNDDFPVPPPPDHPQDRERQHSAPMNVEQELEFNIKPYDRVQIVESIRKVKRDCRGIMTGRLHVDPKPLAWALEVLAQEFQTGIAQLTRDEAEFEKQVLGALPEKWNDRYYAEYDLKYNDRNWVTANAPEELWLTFSVRNNSNRPRPLHFLQSSLLVNGTKIERWQHVLSGAMESANTGDVIEPGALVELRIKCNDFLTREEIQNIVWRVEGFSKSIQPLHYFRAACRPEIACADVVFNRHRTLWLPRIGHPAGKTGMPDNRIW